MPELILTEQQSRLLAQALGPLTLCDSTGKDLGRIEPRITPQVIAELKRRAPLTEEQAKILAQPLDPVTFRDNTGKVLGHLEAVFTAEEIAEAKRRLASPGPFFTGAQVQARLCALQEEWDRTGGFDKAYMETFLARLDAADPGHMRRKGSGE